MCSNSKQLQLNYDELYRDKQRWFKRAMIMRSLLTDEELPEATQTEWKQEYEWVYSQFEDHNKGD